MVTGYTLAEFSIFIYYFILIFFNKLVILLESYNIINVLQNLIRFLIQFDKKRFEIINDIFY